MQQEAIKVPLCGTQTFEIDGTVFEVDLFLLHNERVVIDQEYNDGTGGEIPKYIDLIRKWSGVTTVSGQQAFMVVNRVAQLLELQKKTIETFVSYAGATVSTAGDSQEASSS